MNITIKLTENKASADVGTSGYYAASKVTLAGMTLTRAIDRLFYVWEGDRPEAETAHFLMTLLAEPAGSLALRIMASEWEG